MITRFKIKAIFLLAISLAWPALAPADTPVYRVVDMVRDMHENHEGLPKLAHFFDTVVAKSKCLTLTPGAHEAYGFADQVIQSVKFDKVFSSPIALTLPDNSRVFSLVGEARGDRFVVDYRKATIDSVKLPEFLDFAAEIRVSDDAKPLPDEDRGFGLTLGFKSNLGEHSHHNLMRGGAGFLRVLSPENLRRIPRDPAEKADSELDARMMTEVKGTMPETEMLLRNYVRITPNIKVVRASDGKEHTVIDTALVFQMDKLINDYPELGEYVDRLMTSIDLNIVLQYKLSNGLNVARFNVGTKKQSFVVNYQTRDGLIIPTDKDGKSHPEAAIDLATMKHHDGRVVVDAVANVLGLTITAKDIVTSVKFADGAIARQKVKLESLPTPKVDGRALWIVPTWAIDLTIPGSLDEFLSHFTQGFLHGHRGAGTYGELIVDTTEPKATKVAAIASTELIDNFFINFGMRVAQSYIWPDEYVLADAWNLSGKFTAAIARDLAKLNQSSAAVAH